MLYCIEHNQMVRTEGEKNGVFGHMVAMWNENGGEVDFCEFNLGWATIPPQEFNFDEWLDYVVEPDEQELAIMDENAQLLMADLGV